MEQVRIGIIGIGNMGSAHAQSIVEGKVEGMVLTAVADVNPARLDWAKEKLGEDVARFDDASAMMKSGKIDAVIIAVPHYFHPPYAIEAFENGLHVMCEKPAGVYTKAVREMNEAAQRSGLVFGMMFNQRTNHVFRKMKEIVDSGELGAIKRTNWLITDWYRTQAYYDSGDWRATWSGEGGGVILNQCPHNLDLWQWICGMPKRVHAFCHEGHWHNIEVEDDVTAYVEYENGATGVFITSTGDLPGNNRFEILCEKGRILCEGAGKLTVSKLPVSEREYCFTEKDGFKQPQAEVYTPETDGQNPQHNGVLRAFAAHILHGTPLVAEGAEGIRSLTLSNAIFLSSWLGQTVEIPFDEDLFLKELDKRRATSRRKETVTNTVANLEGTYGSK